MKYKLLIERWSKKNRISGGFMSQNLNDAN